MLRALCRYTLVSAVIPPHCTEGKSSLSSIFAPYLHMIKKQQENTNHILRKDKSLCVVHNVYAYMIFSISAKLALGNFMLSGMSRNCTILRIISAADKTYRCS